MRLVTDREHMDQMQLSQAQTATIKKAHALLKSENGRLTQEGLQEVIAAATSAPVDADIISKLWDDFGCGGQGVTAEGLQEILISGRLYPEHHGRYWVAVSLAEAETLRRILHLRQRAPLLGAASPGLAAGCELAIHLSQAGALGLPGSTMLDASSGWRASVTGATHHEMAVALGCYRFFDCDMHYTRPTLAKLIRALHRASVHDREQFFSSTMGARRRMERKWQETPLAAVFSIADDWVNLKQNAQATFVRLALKKRDLTAWEAFVAFDADNNSRLSPSELYGALRWLEVPELSAEDVVDFFELADANRDGMIEYAEFMSLFEEDGKPHNASGEFLLDDDVFEAQAEVDDSADAQEAPPPSRMRVREPPPKIEPFGADELRTIMVGRRKREMERQREELARRTAQQADLDVKLFREELQASARRKGGSNPRIYLSPADDAALKLYGGSCSGAPQLRRLVVFSFESNSTPLRTSVSGKSKYVPVLIDDVRKNLLAPKCKNGHVCTGDKNRRRWGSCDLCDRYVESKKYCKICYYFVCARCYQAYEDEQVKERSDPAGKHTFIRCEMASDITLHIPPLSINPANPQPSPAPDARTWAVDVAPPLPTNPDASTDEQLSPRSCRDGAVPLSNDFSVTMELKLQSLPAHAQLAALARSSPPDFSQARRRHMASLYVDSRGNVGHNLQSTPPELASAPVASLTSAEVETKIRDAFASLDDGESQGDPTRKQEALQQLVQMLSNVPTPQAKQVLGERLLRLMQSEVKADADKITSKLLEQLDITELVHSISDKEVRQRLTQEANAAQEAQSSDEIKNDGRKEKKEEREQKPLVPLRLRDGRWMVLTTCVQVGKILYICSLAVLPLYMSALSHAHIFPC